MENLIEGIPIAEQRTSDKRYNPYKELQHFFGLTQEELTRLVDVGGGEAVKDLQPIKESLEDLFEQEEIDRWLHAPNPMFNGKTPVDAMIEGQTHRILQLLIRLEEGIHY